MGFLKVAHRVGGSLELWGPGGGRGGAVMFSVGGRTGGWPGRTAVQGLALGAVSRVYNLAMKTTTY